MSNGITIYVGDQKYNEDNDELGFVDGVLHASAYSYCIASFGEVELTKEDTRKIYEVMKEYYGD